MDLLEAVDVFEVTQQAASWQVIGASVAGTSHVASGQPCQDACAWERLPDGTLLLAVSDGAGSALFGEIGAAVAVQAALQTLRVCLESASWPPQEPDTENEESTELLNQEEAFGRDLMQVALESAKNAVEMEAWARQVPDRELASTMILVLATPHLVLAAQIGDGAAVAAEADGTLVALTVPASGEYINQTTFLISPNALESAQVSAWRGEAAHLAAFTDGLQMLALKMPEAAPHPPFFAPLFRFAGSVEEPETADLELAAFLQSPRLTNRTDDDLTLVLATRKG